MIFHARNYLQSSKYLLPSVYNVLFHASNGRCSNGFQSLCYSSAAIPLRLTETRYGHWENNCPKLEKTSSLDVIIDKIRVGSSDDEVFQSLSNDQVCAYIELSHELVNNLLHRFKDDWKSALGVFRWAQTRSCYKHASELYDIMVDILGKARQMEKMRLLIGEMCEAGIITVNTVAKIMRRFAGAGQWEDAVRIFDELGTFGLKKNTESMNLLLDTLCKEHKVQQAREIFLELRQHISPNANTFNIFIHGWCKIGQVEEAYWTLQEMKGHGCHPCVISYSTIIQFYCCQSEFNKVYEILDEMRSQGCQPNVVTYTTIMCYLAKSEDRKHLEEALKISERMKSEGCTPDTLFYNALIHVLGRAGRLHDAIYIFETEMPLNGINPNTSTYNTMIAMFCHHAHEQKAFDYLKRIEMSEFCKPDVQTYYPLLKSCFKSGKTDGLLSQLLDDMVSKHHLSLDVSTYTLLIHGLCRANRAKWAYLLFEEMVFQGLVPRYRTCKLLLDEVKDKCMFHVAERIEHVMTNCKG